MILVDDSGESTDLVEPELGGMIEYHIKIVVVRDSFSFR